MTSPFRVAVAAFVAASFIGARAEAASITVAQFQWIDQPIEGTICPPSSDPFDPCLPTDPIAQSLFRLTGEWDYAAAPAPLFRGSLTLDDAVTFSWLPEPPLDPVALGQDYVDQLLLTGAWLSAATTVSFDFFGETRTLSALLTAPGTALLSFDFEPPIAPPNPVPEPGTLGLLGVGLAALSRSIARRQRADSSPRN